MSIWESVGSSYLEAAKIAFPLHRLVVFAAGFVGSVAVGTQTHPSVAETIARLKLVDLASIRGPLANSALLNIILGIGLVILGWAFSRASLIAVFNLAARGTRLQDRVKRPLGPRDPLRDTASDRQAAVSLIESSLEEPRVRLRALNAFAEMLFGLGSGALIAWLWGNWLDLSIGLLSLLIAVVLDFISVHLFIAEYYGLAFFRAQLQGRKPPDPLDVH